MNQNEKELFLELCRYRDQAPGKLRKLIRRGAATPAVLGQLFYNRMDGIAYCVLRQNALLQSMNREFRNALENAYLRSLEKNESYFRCLRLLTRTLKSCEGKYALLKGAYLCKVYPEGCRTSNDIDILTDPKSITAISDCLYGAGFRQGYLRGGRFVPATRQELISSRYLRGETVPFLKEVGLPSLQYLEVDLNFSLSYQNEESEAVREMISRARRINIGQLRIRTLDPCDFILHVCGHLYKEAAAYPWVQMKRDMTLYKFCDLYTLLHCYTEKDFAVLEQRVRSLKMEQGCYYALYFTKVLFSIKSKALASFLERIAPAACGFLDAVVYPEAKKTYRYREKDILKRFFHSNRLALLEEVTSDDTGKLI